MWKFNEPLDYVEHLIKLLCFQNVRYFLISTVQDETVTKMVQLVNYLIN